MKFTAALLVLLPTVVTSFTTVKAPKVADTILFVGDDPNVVFGGNAWKPDSEKMGSTDTGDYFPEGYNKDTEPAYSEGMAGSQAGGRGSGPALPGMENLGADAVITGGIEVSSEIPAGMEFIPSSVPDQEVNFQISSTSGGMDYDIQVKPVCMTFEDFFAAFSPDSNPSFSVTPATGRMDRRSGGELTELVVHCDPKGQSGNLEGNLVVNLPDDNSKICIKVTVASF